jgi:hypothetical protein
MLGADSPDGETMAQTFDIRFARSTGLLGWLEAPANRFHWKGGGRLNIDGHGVSIGARRSLMNLFISGRSRQIPAKHLRGVYREGDVLRLEFDAPGAPSTALAIWAPNRDSAEQIVRLLPTARTVEMDHTTVSHRFRPDWRVLVMMAAVTALAIFYFMTRPTDHTSAAAIPTLLEPAPHPLEPMSESSAPRPGEAAASQTPDSAAGARRSERLRSLSRRDTAYERDPAASAMRPAAAITPATVSPAGSTRDTDAAIASDAYLPAYGGERAAVYSFKDQLAELRAAYTYLQNSPNAGYAGDLESKWWHITVRLYTEAASQHPDLLPQRELQLAISRAWRNHLFLYAEELREGRLVPGELAQGQLELAEQLAAKL